MIFIYDLILVISTFFIALVGSWAAYHLLLRYKVMDLPNDRSNHTQPVPRGGGIGMVTAVFFFLISVNAPGWLILGMLVLGIISFMDDVKAVPARIRFGAQIAIVLCCVVNIDGRVLDGMAFPHWLEWPLWALAWLWFINLFNFMDGSDGLACSEALAIAIGLFLLSYSVHLPSDTRLIGMIVFGAVSAFLLWNWAPARMFMGDIGSVALGFVLGYALLQVALSGYVAAALILPAYFVADATITLVGRIMRRESIFKAHSMHFYQRGLRRGRTHAQVATNVTKLNAVLIVLAGVSAIYAPISPLLPWSCVALAYAASLWLMHRFTTPLTLVAEPYPELSDGEQQA